MGTLAAGFGLISLAGVAQAQSPAADVAPVPSAAASASGDSAGGAATLRKITVKGQREEQGKQAYKATTTTIGKGKQALRDVPQSVTVLTEKLLDDRNTTTLKEALHQTAGITFLAAEGGEEDIRLRGFSLAATGDIFLDGMREPAFFDRDTFNQDRIELLRGSASMLFGRGSTGGLVNQVSKQPFLDNANEVALTVGTGDFVRTTGDFNVQTGEHAALRINAMVTRADNYGNRVNKEGLAGTYRFGIGQTDEFQVSLFHLDNDNGINYGIPWLSTSTATGAPRGLVPISPKNYYNLASDYNAGSATYAAFSHIHRFGGQEELKTTVRLGHYDRDLRGGAIRFAAAALQPDGQAVTVDTFNAASVLTRGSQAKIQQLDARYLQSDYSNKVQWGGLQHAILAGIDVASEGFENYAASAITKPTTTIGASDDGAWVDESSRSTTLNRTFDAKAFGVYAQDLVQLNPVWKAVGGVRWDYFHGDYWSGNGNKSRSDYLWSYRAGVLYQPTALSSFHLSYGTSFNTSGDTYQYEINGGGGVQLDGSKVDPEGSKNFEIGGKIDAAGGDVTTRFAIFYTVKTNERNRDSDNASQVPVLSGQRHASGFELDVAGRITHDWEVFASYAWTPNAKVDKGAPGSATAVLLGELPGQRPSLTPLHSGSVWTTYQLTERLRVGAGLNGRSKQTPNRNPVGIVAPSWLTGDVMAELVVSPRATFKVSVTNVTNKLYADGLYSGHYTPGAPRSVQFSSTLKF